MTYEHEELVKAVERLAQLGAYRNRVDASKKAGEILNEALDNLDETLQRGLADEISQRTEKEGISGNLEGL
jgi:hypothetical protein